MIKKVKYIVLTWSFLLFAIGLMAHPMPNSVLKLDINQSSVNANLYWPLNELSTAFPKDSLTPNDLLARKKDWLKDYLLDHVKVRADDGQKWKVDINNIEVLKTNKPLTGPYYEIYFNLTFVPPPNKSTRHFTIDYDAIMHQLVTHKLIVEIDNDWKNGLVKEHTGDETDEEPNIGVLAVKTSNGKIEPIIINLEDGNNINGFTSMLKLGVTHIKEGADHLVFLFLLLLTAPLVKANKLWTLNPNDTATLWNILKIVTAFTIGHSLSLIAVSIGWLHINQQLVEVAIGITILITAIDIIIPFINVKEHYVALTFGLVHGFAFGSVISNMNLNFKETIISILGFNIGIELMQLFLVICIIPWIILLSKTIYFKFFKLLGAALVSFASIVWIINRSTNKLNNLANEIDLAILEKGIYFILILVLSAIICFLINRRKKTEANSLQN